jgi:hypothetical protein
MTFRREEAETFLAIFMEAKPAILSFPGCTGVELWRGAADSNQFTTCSTWVSEEALNNYRNSEIFRQTWSKTKPLFSSKAMAFSFVKTNT